MRRAIWRECPTGTPPPTARSHSPWIIHTGVYCRFSTKKAVWLIYFFTLILCLSSVVVVNLRNETAGLFLIVLGAGAVIFVRKLGYFEYIGSDKIYGWFKDAYGETAYVSFSFEAILEPSHYDDTIQVYDETDPPVIEGDWNFTFTTQIGQAGAIGEVSDSTLSFRMDIIM